MSTSRIQRQISNSSFSENFCSHIPEKLPLRYMTLQGGHDSITDFTINSPLDPSLGIPNPVLWLMDRSSWIEKVIKQHILYWGEAQDTSTYAQLMNGARYFDLRIIDLNSGLHNDPTGNDFYTKHGMISNESLKSALQAINKFLDDHPQEFVILDCQSFSNMQNNNNPGAPDKERHARLCHLLKDTFKTKLTSEQYTVKTTRTELREKRKQVIVAYHEHEIQAQNRSYFWPGNRISSVWPKADSLNGLKSKLDQILASQQLDDNKLHILQGVITPNAQVTIKGLFFRWFNKKWAPGSLKDCAELVNPKLEKWLKTRWKDRHINIIIADHLQTMSHHHFPNLIQRNYQTAEKFGYIEPNKDTTTIDLNSSLDYVKAKVNQGVVFTEYSESEDKKSDNSPNISLAHSSTSLTY